MASIIDSLAFFRGTRSIGGIIPSVVIEEEHRDELAVTDHPVERGATISDHAFLLPFEVTARYGWSSSAGLFSGTSSDVQGVYEQLQALQATREPFDLVTGKRMYTNMLLRSLGVTTDARTEAALLVTATFRQVILVDTSTTTLTPSEDQASPQDTAAVVNTGTKQPTAVSESALSKIGSVLGLRQ